MRASSKFLDSSASKRFCYEMSLTFTKDHLKSVKVVSAEIIKSVVAELVMKIPTLIGNGVSNLILILSAVASTHSLVVGVAFGLKLPVHC